MTNHRHEGFNMLPQTVAGFGPAGRGSHADPADDLDAALIGRLVGAAYDGCTKCVEEGLDRLATDPPTTARLIELACRALRSLLDELPSRRVGKTVPAPDAPELCCIVTGFRPDRRRLYETVVRMDEAFRRSTAATALDVIVSDLTSGGALDGAWRSRNRATPW